MNKRKRIFTEFEKGRLVEHENAQAALRQLLINSTSKFNKTFPDQAVDVSQVLKANGFHE
jgi:hypothetical protein